MRTPARIEHGIKCCASTNMAKCIGCPYQGIRDCRTQLFKDTQDYLKSIRKVAGRIEQYARQLEAAQPKWISVDERLPEESGCYLVAINCPKGRWSECNSYDHLEKRWSSEWECFREDTTELVTHWMPLPESPEVKR